MIQEDNLNQSKRSANMPDSFKRSTMTSRYSAFRDSQVAGDVEVVEEQQEDFDVKLTPMQSL